MSVLEVCHENLGAAVKRVDDHLPINRPRDLHRAVTEILGDRSDFPIPFTDRPCLLEELRHHALIQLPLHLLTSLKKPESRRIEATMQARDKRHGFRRQYTRFVKGF